MKKILCVGQVAYDITLLVDEYPEENKKSRIKGYVECAGGSAFNSAYLLNSWGVDTTFVGTIGNDYYGSKIEEEIKECNMKAELTKLDGFTTTSYIITNINKGTRTILTNKNLELKSQKFTNYNYDLIVLDSNEIDLSLEIVKKYPNAIKILDAGKLCDEVLELGKYVDYFVCSKDFAEKFTDIKLDNEENIRKAYDLIEKSFNKKIVITLESMGSFTKENDKYVLVPSIKVKAVDSTGAGDIYHGAFAYFISKGNNILDVMRYANIAGALSVKKIGSKASVPKLEDVIMEAEII